MGRKYTAQEREGQISQLCEGTIYSFAGWVDEYRNSTSKFICRCEKHGEWNANADNFVNKGRRCPGCKRDSLSLKNTITEEVRKNQILKLCGGTIYSFVGWVGEYCGNTSKFICRCEKHGEWNVNVDNFMTKGTRCPACAKTGFDQTKPATLYAIRSDCGQYVKIGITNDFKQRLSQLRKATPFDVSVIERIECDGQTARQFEKMFHDEFESAGFTGFDGATEWLQWSTELQYWLRLLK